jgi:hypothetical protein
MNEHVATVEFTDGVWRPVYEQSDGRQYVDVDGEPVYGVWYIKEATPGMRPGVNGTYKQTAAAMPASQSSLSLSAAATRLSARHRPSA